MVKILVKHCLLFEYKTLIPTYFSSPFVQRYSNTKNEFNTSSCNGVKLKLRVDVSGVVIIQFIMSPFYATSSEDDLAFIEL